MERKCIVCGKNATRMVKGMLLCPKHSSQWYRHHEFNDNTIYAPNDYIYHDDYAEIVLRDRYHKDIGHALIDLDDIEKCKQYKWHLRKGPYVIASIPEGVRSGTKKMHLHRLISDYFGNELCVDHINRNPLDNRKVNLRITNFQTNSTNKGDTGVIRVPSGRYQAHVTRHYEPIYIGTFNTFDEALEARKKFVEMYDANDSTRVLIPVASDNQYAERIS